MFRNVILAASAVFCFSIVLHAQNNYSHYNSAPYISGGLNLGYSNGFALLGNITVSNLAQDFPFSMRLGLGYASVDPGNPYLARKMFINDNTNGVPQKSGKVWDFRMDFIYPTKILSLQNSFIFVGPRFSTFTAEFDFIDGNEFFNINSQQWGIGGGAEGHFLIVQRVDLILTAGLDYYFSSTLEGHDTSYGPDGTSINPRNYNYRQVDDAINQPKVVVRFMAGFNYYF